MTEVDDTEVPKEHREEALLFVQEFIDLCKKHQVWHNVDIALPTMVRLGLEEMSTDLKGQIWKMDQQITALELLLQKRPLRK